MFPSRGTVRYEERGQGYRDVEKVGKRWSTVITIEVWNLMLFWWISDFSTFCFGIGVEGLAISFFNPLAPEFPFKF